MNVACALVSIGTLLILLAGLIGTKPFSDCCDLGRQHIKPGGDTAASCYEPPVSFDHACRLAFTACCIEAQQQAACHLGMLAARNDSACTDIALDNDDSLVVARQCCICCTLTQTWNSSLPRIQSGWCGKAMQICSDDVNFWSTAVPNTTAETTSAFQESTQSPDPKICPKNHNWNPMRRVCEKITIACPHRFFFDRNKGFCVKYDKELAECPKGHRHDSLTLDCEDIDECAENRSLCAGKEFHCINQPGSYKCLCRIGYRIGKDGQCTDIDECALGLDNCRAGQRCNNRAGGFRCVRIVGCGFGYTLDDETQECQDIDECKTIEDVCEVGMRCFNLPGSYICKEESCPNGLFRDFKTGKCHLCRRGYLFDNETRRCKDINECAEGLHNCNKQQRCENNAGSFQCRNRVVCELGFRISKSSMTCEDINECTEKRHECEDPYVCVNSKGSYYCRLNPCNSYQKYDDELQKCTCKEGYREVKGSCQDIDECAESKRPLCKQNDVCVNAHGSYFCEPFTSCSKGFRRPNNFSACVDIDECALGTHRCERHAQCTNIPGSYACICEHGFRKNDDDRCEDVDECRIMSRSRTCPGKHMRCVNVIGSFVCECEPGFMMFGSSRTCEDIDECRRNKSICGIHKCHNLVGSFQCKCADGYRMSPDRKACFDVDECELFKNRICPNSACINIEGSYQCDCPVGYRPNPRGICVDINECAVNVCKRQNMRCINLRGSFRCLYHLCPPDYEYSPVRGGYRCNQNEDPCKKGDTACLHRNPKIIATLFTEIDNRSLPVPVHDLADRSTADDLVFTNTLTILRVQNPNGAVAVIPPDSFRLAVRRYAYLTTVTVIANGRIPAPLDVRLELRRNALSAPQPKSRHRLHLFDSVTFINIFVTQVLA